MKNQKGKNEIIISLTSYPARINTVNQAIESPLNQTMKADKVILWLAPEQFPNKEKDLPKELLKLQDKGLTIDWYEDIKSYKKLIPALEKYPDSVIVTADDDLIYESDWLEKLYKAYKKHPEMLHCHRAHRITFDKQKNLNNYNDWLWDIYNVKPSFNNFFTGVGGVLYPPLSLYKDVLNKDLFTRLAQNADDIWFWAMAVMNNRKINVIANKCFDLHYIEGTQDNSLWHDNVDNNRNDEQMKNVLEYYPNILEKLDKRKFNRPVGLLKMIFSIRNEYHNGTKHKIITVLGIKFKIKITNNCNKLNVVFITDNGFVIPTATALTSLIKNKNKNTKLNIYLVLSNVEEENIEKFKQYNDENTTINIIKANSDKYLGFHKFDKSEPCCATISALLKFELPNLLNNLDKVLYLDGDIIVKKDLFDLYNHDFLNNYVVAVNDSGKIYYNSEAKKNGYFNSGVMLLNLKKLRDENMPAKLVQTKKESKDNSLMDQNIFNQILLPKVRFIDIRYNFLYINLIRACNRYKMSDINKVYNSHYKNLNDIYKKAYIIHFSSKDKPWKFKNSICSKLWLKYYKQSLFYDRNAKIQTLNQDIESPLYVWNFSQKIFSINESADKLHKIIILLGFKIKLRNK